MNIISIPVIALLVSALVRLAARNSAKRESDLGSTGRLRRDILARRVDPPDGGPCAVMDWRPGGENATLIVYPSGESRLLFIEQQHTISDEDGRAQGPVKRFRDALEEQSAELHETDDLGGPPSGHACFWLVRDYTTLTSGDVPIDEIKLRTTAWTSAWGSGSAAVSEILEGYRKRRAAMARSQDVASGPRPV